VARAMSAFGPSYPGEAAGGGTSTDLAALSVGSPIDLTDGSWTLEDPDTLVKSVSFATGVNTVTFNALAAGNLDYVLQSNHADFRAPRWYRDWNVNGTRMNSDSLSIWQVILDADETVFDFNHQIAVGVCAAPTTVVRNDIEVGAALFTQDNGANWRYGVWMGPLSTTPGASNQFARSSCIGQYGGGQNGNAEFIALNSLNERVQNGARAGNQSVSSADLSEVVSVGTFNGGSTISDRDWETR